MELWKILRLAIIVITSFAVTYFLIPIIIRIAKNRNLIDVPNDRSSHDTPTPSLGGIGIFAGTICAIVCFMPMSAFGSIQYMLASFVIIFLIGTLDDITPVTAIQKLVGQILVSSILIIKCDVVILSFYGMFGIGSLPFGIAYFFSLFAIVGIINAYNLIDGINGLAGSIGLIACLFFGVWFYRADQMAYATIAFSLTGSLLAFLRYNFTPAQIFMGDTGSLLLGTACAILTVKFIDINYNSGLGPDLVYRAGPALALSALILPIFDTLRVFTLRTWRGKSPFTPDKTHIHHLLIRAGFSHTKSTIILIGVNIFFIVFTIIFDHLGSGVLVTLQVLLMILISLYFRHLAHTNIKHDNA